MLMLVASTLAVALATQPYDFSDVDGLSLLQVAAVKHNHTDVTHSKMGGYGCTLSGDVHTVNSFAGGNPDLHKTGLYEYAKSADGRFNAQLYQCGAWHTVGVGWINAVAFDIDGTRVVILPPVFSGMVNSNPIYIRANDIVYSSTQTPFTIPGTTIEVRRHGVDYQLVIVTEGFEVAVTMNTAGGAAGYSYINTGIKFGSGNNPLANSNSFCTNGAASTPIADSSVDADWSMSLFTDADHRRICDFCNDYNGQSTDVNVQNQKCDSPPELPPPPPAKKECEDNGCSWIHSQELCSSLQGDAALYNDCLFDFCVSCDDNAGAEFIQAIEDNNPSPICVQGAAECNPEEVCSKAVTMNTLSVTQNNLGGVGPDAGAEEIRYGNAAVVGGRTVDLVLTTDGTFKTSKPTKNGKSGPFGILNVLCGTSVTVTMKVLDSESGAPVTLDAVALTWYDLDEGKKEKGRATVTTCGSTGAIVSQNTELTVKREGACSTATSSTAGTGKDNPKSPHQLSSLQISRALTLPFKGVSEWTSTLSLSTGYKGRNFMFALEPSVACGTSDE